MNNVKILWVKHSLISVLSLGFMVLGIGSISWAMFSMTIPSTFAAQLNEFTGDSTGPVAFDQGKFQLFWVKYLSGA